MLMEILEIIFVLRIHTFRGNSQNIEAGLPLHHQERYGDCVSIQDSDSNKLRKMQILELLVQSLDCVAGGTKTKIAYSMLTARMSLPRIWSSIPSGGRTSDPCAIAPRTHTFPG